MIWFTGTFNIDDADPFAIRNNAAIERHLMHVEKTFLRFRALVDLLGLISNGIDAPNCMAVTDSAGDIYVLKQDDRLEGDPSSQIHHALPLRLMKLQFIVPLQEPAIRLSLFGPCRMLCCRS